MVRVLEFFLAPLAAADVSETSTMLQVSKMPEVTSPDRVASAGGKGEMPHDGGSSLLQTSTQLPSACADFFEGQCGLTWTTDPEIVELEVEFVQCCSQLGGHPEETCLAVANEVFNVPAVSSEMCDELVSLATAQTAWEAVQGSLLQTDQEVLRRGELLSSSADRPRSMMSDSAKKEKDERERQRPAQSVPAQSVPTSYEEWLQASRRRRTEPHPDFCFPGSASVTTTTGRKSMFELKVGDLVRTIDSAGDVTFEPVYFFGHADHASDALYTTLQLEQLRLSLTGSHFIKICPISMPDCSWMNSVHTYADQVNIGDAVWIFDGNAMVTQKVVHVIKSAQRGLFNPYTLSGNIIVDGVVASAHSRWILDDWVPTSATASLPAVYQAMFFPGRVLYHLAGPFAAKCLDVDNPQQTFAGWGPQFLAVAAIVSGMCMWSLVMYIRVESMKWAKSFRSRITSSRTVAPMVLQLCKPTN